MEAYLETAAFKKVLRVVGKSPGLCIASLRRLFSVIFSSFVKWGDGERALGAVVFCAAPSSDIQKIRRRMKSLRSPMTSEGFDCFVELHPEPPEACRISNT